MNNIYAIFKRAKFSLNILLLVLFIVGLYLLSLFNQSCARLDAIAEQSSQIIITDVLKRERIRLARLAHDYAVSNLPLINPIENPKADDLKKVFQRENIIKQFGISHLAIVTDKHKVLINSDQGDVAPGAQAWFEQPDIETLMQQVHNDKKMQAQPATGFVRMGDHIELVSVAMLTPQTKADGLKNHPGQALLIMTKSLSPLLVILEKRFQFEHIRLRKKGTKPASTMASVNITSPSEHVLTQITWQPKMPGTKLWQHTLPSLIAVLITLGLMLVLFWRQINRYFHLSLRSADELAQTHLQLNELAYFDTTTKLPNRSLGLDRLNQALKTGKRSGLMTAVVFIDLDGFKAINDKYGHIIGDQVLEQVGQNISSCIRQEDTLARFGGDEFIVVLARLQQEEDVDIVVHKIWQVFNEIFYVKDNLTQLTASIGVAVSPRDGIEAEELIHKADHAMYHTKHSGKNNYGYFVGEISASRII